MIRLALAAIALGAVPSANLPAVPSVTGHAMVDAFLADVEAGRRAGAISRVANIESITDHENVVATPTELVDMLLQCTCSTSRQHPRNPILYEVTWRCPDGEYWLVLDVDFRSPQLTVGQFVTMQVREELVRPPTTAPARVLPSPSKR